MVERTQLPKAPNYNEFRQSLILSCFEYGERQVPIQSVGTAGTCLGGGCLRVLIYYREHKVGAGIEQSRQRCSSFQDFP
jgi:hypothetical protein